MQTVFIKFSSQDDRVRGFYELATKAQIGSFPNEVYQVPVEALRCSTVNPSVIGVPPTSRSRRPMIRFDISPLSTATRQSAPIDPVEDGLVFA